MRTTLYLLACFALATARLGFAQGNLPDASYPSHECGAKPSTPIRPEKLETNEAVNAYNSEVETYNSAVETYVSCIQAYIDGASQDIEMIRTLIKNAVDEANK